MHCNRLNRFLNLLMNNYTSQQFSTLLRQHGWNTCPLLIQVCWERKWRAKHSNKFYVLLCVSVFPPDDTCVALALRFQNIALRTSIRSRTPKILNFEWQARHHFCDCSFCTQGQRQLQGPKVKEERKWKEGSVRGKQVPSGSSNATYGTCEGDLPLIDKHFLTVDLILRE